MKKFIQEFKDFAIKGNMIDMAIGIIIGTAFNKVLNVLVKKVIMPPLSLMTEDVQFSEKKHVLREAHGEVSEVAIGYGELVEVVLDFAIISFTIFVVIKFMNRFQTKAEDPSNLEEKTPKNIELLANLEQLMKEQNDILRDLQK
ncbi:MAG: large conductance mechanosensitive channel protein MscL [Maribacter sp.]|nr:large conductance mechanosensitive channel protein MscL [Maribacter sp.]